MSKRAVFLDSFSGTAAGLPKGRREALDVLRALAQSPAVSVWDMSETAWLRARVYELCDSGLVYSDKTSEYPWHRYRLTDAGRAAIAKASA